MIYKTSRINFICSSVSASILVTATLFGMESIIITVFDSQSALK